MSERTNDVDDSEDDSDLSDVSFVSTSEGAADTKADNDFDFLDIELPDESGFQPAQWIDDRYEVVRGDGTIYEGSTENGNKCGKGTLYDENRTQYVTGEWNNDKLVELHFAQFLLPSETEDLFKINVFDDLITSNKYQFVARITKQPLNLLCQHFPTIREKIQSKIEITRILDDDLRHNLNNWREEFNSLIKKKQQFVTSSRIAQRDMFHLYLLMEEMKTFHTHEDKNENINVLDKIYNNKCVSQELRDGANNACIAEHNVVTRNRKLPIMKLSDFEYSWKNVIIGPEDIRLLPDRQLFTCSVYDIQLFKDLELTVQHCKSDFPVNDIQEFVKKYVCQLWKMLLEKIKRSNLNDIPEASVYTNTVFIQLFKTFLELLGSIYREHRHELKYLVTFIDNGDLQLVKDRNLGLLEKRLEFLINLSNHFKPGDVKTYKFSYTFSFFQIQESQNWLKGKLSAVVGYVRRYFDNTINNIPEECVIWLYYIHFCFSDLTQEISHNQNELSSFLNSLMDLFITVIKNKISLEKVRVLSNSVIKFGLTICPYFKSQTTIYIGDMELLLQQAEYIKDFVTSNEHALNDITNIIDIYQVFWDERKNLKYDITSKSIPSEFTDELISTLNSFIKYVFTLKIYNNKFLTFLRSLNEFIRLLRSTNFPWYIQKNSWVPENLVQCVNKDNHSYLVKNTEKFLEELKNNSENLPRHYLIETSVHFIKCSKKFLNNCSWDEKMQASSDLLNLMGRSLINFNELSNANDFDKFFAVFTEPFVRVTTTSCDFNDFKRRLNSLENYYRYTIELNVMGVEKALKLCKDKVNFLDGLNLIKYDFNSSLLEECFNCYLGTFNTYVADYILDQDFKIKKLIDKVKSNAKHVYIKKWDSDYKKNKLPKLLAGLSAVWSALESKDVIYQKEITKPQIIQILCILRLLGVDQPNKGFDNQLAQVLTGQGKSIILGLLAATLALTGNLVRIVCYNKYLADRDQSDFKNFFTVFNIHNMINYGTFDNMANEIISPNLKGVNYSLRKFVDDLVTGELKKLYVKEEDNVVKNTVLLIDEVDVFFTPQFYGNTYNPCTTIDCEVIGDLQIKIWNLTSTTVGEDDLRVNMKNHIFEIYSETRDETFKNLVTNSESFLFKQVEEMISNAVLVRNISPNSRLRNKYKLNTDNDIIRIDDTGEYKRFSYDRYKNVFMYFMLKKNNFSHNNFKNYGYLIVNCGNISYAMLPNNFRAILGVTGTLRQLSELELRAVASYDISRGSDMPTFFGSNKLRVTNFKIEDTEDAWSTAILHSILSIVEQKRATIVFFEDELAIEKVKDKFTSHLSYSVLTGNETHDEVTTCVQQAGVAKTVTIATRRMGRGVDFQSNDSAVESAGGVHVIQTFFSDDVKEETQIKGRTARKDNSGSYELILCREHLKYAGYEDNLSSYEELNTARLKKAKEKDTELEKQIEKSKKKHFATMDFLRSFYNYKPSNRNEYFEKYPFIKLE